MKYFVCLLVFLFSFDANAKFEDWSDEHKKLFYINTGTIALDWYTTSIGLRSDNIVELNPFLGPKPTQRTLNKFAAIRIGLSYVIANNSSEEVRETYLKITSFVNLVAVGNNIYIVYNFQ